MYGCAECGEFRAPKHRGLNEYYHFCLTHVQEYNKAWNFFSGMSDDEVMDHMRKSYYGFRPTWKYGVNGDATDALRDQIHKTYHFTEEPRPRNNQNQGYSAPNGFESTSPEFQALAIMGLAPPVDLKTIKTRYKELAKKHHPDLNRGCSQSEELLKQVNMAYTILKLAFEKFEDLPHKP